LAVGIVTNIDNRKQNEKELAEYRAQLELLIQELIHAKEKAEESDKLKSAFLGNMSHEIRTPLNAIVGVLQLLDSNTLTDKDRKDCMKLMMNSSTQLAAILDVIIDISKIDAGQMNINPAPVQLNQLMNEMRVFFEDYIQSSGKKHIELILDESGFIDNNLIYIDPEQFRQVFYNLISNAIKFTEKGYICFGYRQSVSDMLEFTVHDTGIGLTPEEQEVIFKPFRQVELGNNRQYGGAGLGLTISRSLVQMEGGKIWVESTEGEGASFYFTLPYLPIAPEDLQIFDDSKIQKFQNSKNESLNKFKDKSVLVVEPTLLKFYYYEKLILATGASVTRIENLQQWRDLAEHSKIFDVVIADASLLDNKEFDNISNLPTVLVISEEKEKYRQLVGNKLCTIEVPIVYAKILEKLKKYAG
jgi:signal transduction histidine kinase